jgi:HSP20 family protein
MRGCQSGRLDRRKYDLRMRVALAARLVNLEDISMLTRWSDWSNLLDWPDMQGNRFDRAFRNLDQLRREMERAFQGVDRGEWSRGGFTYGGPSLALDDSGPSLIVRADLPGVSEKDIELSVNAQTLTIRGHRKAGVPDGYTVHRKERGDYRFERSFQLPCKVDPDKVEATIRQGVLTLTLPKAPEAQPKQISVRAA